MHGVAVGQHPFVLETEMVFHVTGRDVAEVIVASLELAHDVFDGLSQHLREHIDTAAVRHRDRDMPCARRRGFRDRRVEHRHERVGAFDRKALVSGERAAKESFEAIDFGEARQQGALLIRRKRSSELFGGKERAEPLALFFGAAMHELDGEIARVAVLETLGDVTARGKMRKPERRTRDEREIVLGDAIVLDREFRGARRRRAKRVELDREISVSPNRVQISRNTHDLAREILIGRRTQGIRDTSAKLGGEAEELAPRFLDGSGVAAEIVVLLSYVCVVEDRRDDGIGHASNLAYRRKQVV